MRTTADTGHVSGAIGGQVRLYHAYITTAPASLDAPSTVTLYDSTATDLAGFAIDPDAIQRLGPRTSARLVLIDAVEFTWPPGEARHQLTAPNGVLVSSSTLQLWLWAAPGRARPSSVRQSRRYPEGADHG